jgi:hypothetical protein
VVRRRGVPRRFASFVLLLALPALATTLVAMDVAALTRASRCVVRARVASVSALRSDAGRITTAVEVERLETWAGPDLEVLRVLVPGGVVGNVGQRVEGAPRFVQGEEVVLFLAAHGPAFQPVGLAEGVWRVDRSSGSVPIVRPEPLEGGVLLVGPDASRAASLQTPMPLDALRAQVRAAGTP